MACARRMLSPWVAYPQQVVNIAVINEQAVECFVDSWPWWIWLLIVLGFILFLCLLLTLLSLCFQLRMRKRKVTDSKSRVPPPNSVESSNILFRAKEMEANGALEESLGGPSKQPRPSPSSTQIFRIPSNLSPEIADSTASQSRIEAVARRQQQPYNSCPKGILRNKMDRRYTLRPQVRTRHLESVVEEYDKYKGATESRSKFRTTPPVQLHTGQLDSERMVHQQTTCEEKFFQKSNRENGMLEEGYDYAQLTYTVPERYFFHSEIV